MATFKAEVQNRRADGTYNIRIRVTHNRVVRRMSTNMYVVDADLTRGLKIKNAAVIDKCDALVNKCREACNLFGYEINNLSVDELICRLKNHLQGGENFKLNFIEYMEEKAGLMKKSTGDTYRNAASALRRYLNGEVLDISHITASFLSEFENYLAGEPSQRGSNRKGENDAPQKKGGRAVSKYLACIRAIHNAAKNEFNDEENGIVRVRLSPFKKYKIKAQPITRKRGLTPKLIQSIIDLPYEEGGRSRLNLAKDCFILSFALIGMNGVDMYHVSPAKRRTVVYNRRKTADRRDDNAEMQVRIEHALDQLIEKYADPTGKRLFNFYIRYSNSYTFNEAVNCGLKQIGEKLGIEKLEFYAARHSWATIARSAGVEIDKATVHEALNHASGSMAITDIYIDRDWTVIWNANRKVLDLFDWSAVGYDLL